MSLSSYSLQSKVLLHPLVMFQIVDAYERRPMDDTQVMGTLLGTVAGNTGRIDITSCYSVVHRLHADDSSHIDLDLRYDSDMCQLMQFSYPQEKVLGWFSTGSHVSEAAVELHEYYARRCQNGQPLHLLMDTSLRGKLMNPRLFCAVQTGVPGGTKGLLFTRLPMEIYFGSAETVALRHMKKQCLSQAKDAGPTVPQFKQVVESTKELQLRLNLMLSYINDVLNYKRLPDNSVGRALHDALAAVPPVESERFRHMFNNNVRDLLMSMTLSSLVKNQLELSEQMSNMSDA
ncbi:eukaryotic translation initiation factor 3 subunit F-2 [Drosophila subobscura]|uniref:eukaryotic translation initiation factor 3 subunit F-2 n=1 Tax=Drosophila subobscura TaxID=7241 RepID=UPI00155ABB04|nr:eukaryotic translation initiation factor 3 subunit F-2 [Drosophila subobscura]